MRLLPHSQDRGIVMTTQAVFRDETDNDMDGWRNENGTLPGGWYRIDGAIASGPYGSEAEAHSQADGGPEHG